MKSGRLQGKAGLLILLIFIFLVQNFSVSGQQINLNVVNQTLSDVIYKVAEEYNLQVSFNARHLSKTRVTIDQTFSSPEKAMQQILSGSDFEYIKQDEVFIILKRKQEKFILQGIVIDKYSGESLPFAHLILNDRGIISDAYGNFIIENNHPEFHLKISYIGYYINDTILHAGVSQIFMTPSVHKLEEIEIKGEIVARSMETGESPGQVRLNQKTARKLPGNGDNSVFNFLRLQPGILAAGEQSSDLIIWGSYEGHTKVLFDGFTIYGLKNFNDNISAVNPYMAKDILVLKGGYNVEYGGRVGGIVNVTGVDGNRNKPSLNLNINNMTLNGMASVPVLSSNALTVAFRRTYYNLYDSENIPVNTTRRGRAVSDITVIPDYTFGDFNFKFAGDSEKLGNYFISFFRGRDNFLYNVDFDRQLSNIKQSMSEMNDQTGSAIYWNKKLSGKLITDVSLSHSELNKNETFFREVTRSNSNRTILSNERTIVNGVSEFGLENSYYYTAGHRNQHQFKGGVAYKNHRINLLTVEDGSGLMNTNNQEHRAEVYLKDRYQITGHSEITAGVRIDYPALIGKPYIQPRISYTFKPNSITKAYAAWGIYNQYISKTTLTDDYGNLSYFWAISDGENVPVLSGMHNVIGFSLGNHKISVNSEAYFKRTKGLTRYVNLLQENIIQGFEGDGFAYGADLLLKGRYNKHEGWIGYTWSKALEYFPYFSSTDYRYAPHDQRHEFKGSVLLNLHPIYVSANYVYGSGFLLRSAYNATVDSERYPYSRLDAAVIYNLSVSEYKFEIGLSVLNILNTENIKYANFTVLPTEQQNLINIHAEAVPFTPAIYLNMSF